jgi:hypothetical protein
MEPNGVTPELALRAYEAITYYAAWIFAAVAYVAMLSYLVFVSRECYLLCCSPRAKSGHRAWADPGCVRSQSEPIGFSRRGLWPQISFRSRV